MGKDHGGASTYRPVLGNLGFLGEGPHGTGQDKAQE
jgi:hypothetical protein